MAVEEVFEELKALVDSLRAEEERSHSERESIMRECLDEIRSMKAEVERVREGIDQLVSILQDAKVKLDNYL